MSLYKDLSHQIINCCFEVHNSIGPGFLEKVYQEALCVELNESFLNFDKEVEFPVMYKQQHLGFNYKADIVVENKIIVELKALSSLQEVHTSQCINYLKVSGLKVCLLINFGGKSVEIKMLVG